jgi:hypothetical protein
MTYTILRTAEPVGEYLLDDNVPWNDSPVGGQSIDDVRIISLEVFGYRSTFGPVGEYHAYENKQHFLIKLCS